MIHRPLIIVQSQRLQCRSTVILRDDEKSKLNFIAGWMGNFKRQWNLNYLRAENEWCDTDNNAMKAVSPQLLVNMNSINVCNVFDADECG